MFKLTHPTRSTGSGEGAHRHGWAEVMVMLKKMEGGKLLLDDFMDYTFDPAPHKIKYHREYRQPWAGILHHPPDIPEWYNRGGQSARKLLTNKRFLAALPHLKLIIVLSDYLKQLLRGELTTPIVVIKHPAGVSPRQFDAAAFAAMPLRRVLQIGWYMKNTMAIYQIDAPKGFRKYHISPDARWIARSHKRCLSHYIKRPQYGETVKSKRLSDSEYDRFMCIGVTFMELIDASANNTILDCIGRNAPLVVNRHPAAVEYLGKDYPLFYDHIADAGKLLTVERCLAAHEHLKAMDKQDLTYEHFKAQVAAAISKHC